MATNFKAFVTIWIFLSTLGLSIGANHAIAQPAFQGPAHLGVTIEKNDPEPGALVTGVLRRSPAEAAGVTKGDRILKVGPTVTHTVFDVRGALRAFQPGDRVAITIKSATREKSIVVTARVEAQPSPEVVLDRQLAGLSLPDFKLKYLAGTPARTVRSSSLKDKFTIVEFWATWCGPCRKISPKLAEIQSKYPEQLRVVGVSSESAGTIRKFLAKNPVHYPVAQDSGGLGHTRCAVITIPTMLLVDKRGVVVGTYVGLNGLSKLKTDVDSRLRAVSPR